MPTNRPDDRRSSRGPSSPRSLHDSPEADAALVDALKRRRTHIESEPVGWRRISAMLAALLIMIVLLVVTGSRGNHFLAARWFGQAMLGGHGHGKFLIDPNSEVGQLEFQDGQAELGRFSVRVYEPVAKRSLLANFKLDGMTDCKDKDAFQQFMARNYRFFREQVSIAIRNSPASDLADPEHRVLRKRIVARVNRALGRNFLSDIDLTGFSLHESLAEGGFQPILTGKENVLEDDEPEDGDKSKVD